MGYSTDSTGRLCCDQCGRSGGVRRHKCPHMVLTDSLHGARSRLHYCMPPALCGTCYKSLGGLRGVHTDERCKAGAAASQAEADAIETALDAGEAFVVSAWGDWQAGVPAGMAGVAFSSRAGTLWRLVTSYDQRARRKLSDYPGALVWDSHPGAATKQVSTLAELVTS